MKLLPYVHQEDIGGWPDLTTRKLVLVMLQIAQGRIRGEYIDGDYNLLDCRQTFMFETKRKDSHWIIFRFLREGVELVAVGPFFDSSVFTLAEARLDRA